jgi:hypothetical protein
MGEIGYAAHRLLGPVREGDDAIEKLKQEPEADQDKGIKGDHRDENAQEDEGSDAGCWEEDQ